MNGVFCDTSALFAVLDRDSEGHAEAAKSWQALVSGDIRLVTTNYIIVEMTALLQRRIGLEVVRRFQLDMLPVIDVEWMDQITHDRAMQTLLTANRRPLSLVDCALFDTMRRLGLVVAFTFDQHFAEQGFERYTAEIA